MAQIVLRPVGVRHVHIFTRNVKLDQRPPCTISLTHYVHVVHIPGMTKLDTWMGDDRDDLWLARALNCSRSQASRIRRGKSIPSLETAVAIEKLTKGKVRPSDLLVAPLREVAANDTAPQAKAA